jgi:hypothetical protein
MERGSDVSARLTGQMAAGYILLLQFLLDFLPFAQFEYSREGNDCSCDEDFMSHSSMRGREGKFRGMEPNGDE